ncbi:MAG: hypothetical protein D6822_08425 [Cyanobacteria bacterium J149]|nr:MAG: hypothetical protein D6822_08425 [Cyanobacteria bacterium J149]
MDVLVTIDQLAGTSDNQTYSTTNTNVRAIIIPASNEAVALYENMPQGQMYQFRILSDDIGNLKQQSRITITDAQSSVLSNGDVFITINDTKRTRASGKHYLIGLCYKQE